MPNKRVLEDDALSVLADFLSDSLEDAPNLQLPSPELLGLYKDLANRVLWIRGEVDDPTMAVVRHIQRYNIADKDIPVEQRKPIKLYIDTNGGSVPVMWSIINAIKMSKTPVYTINFCNALSAGAHILAAGHKRFGMPGSTVLVHSGSCMYGGTAEQADSAKKYYDALGKKADDLFLADTNIDKKIFNKKKVVDWYIDTEEALKYNIIDKIVDDFVEIA